jgi:hypothetical protein
MGHLTGGVYNAQNLLLGNNAVCFALQAARLATPDLVSGPGGLLGGLLSPLVGALNQVSNVLTGVLVGLGCPALSTYDRSAFDGFPGARQGHAWMTYKLVLILHLRVALRFACEHGALIGFAVFAGVNRSGMMNAANFVLKYSAWWFIYCDCRISALSFENFHEALVSLLAAKHSKRRLEVLLQLESIDVKYMS